MMTKALREAQDSLSLVFEEGRLDQLEPLLRLIFQTLISHEVGLDKSIVEKSSERWATSVSTDEVARECVEIEKRIEVVEKENVPLNDNNNDILAKTEAVATPQVAIFRDVTGHRDSDIVSSPADIQKAVVANVELQACEEIALESRAGTQQAVVENVAAHRENGEIIVRETVDDAQQVNVEDVAASRENVEIVQETTTDTLQGANENVVTHGNTAEIERGKAAIEKELADKRFKELMFEGFIGAIRRRDAARKAEAERIAAKEAEKWLAEDAMCVEKQPVLPTEVAGKCELEHSETHSGNDEVAKPKLASEPLVEEGLAASEEQSSVKDSVEEHTPVGIEDNVEKKETGGKCESDLSKSDAKTLYEEAQSEKVLDSAEDSLPLKDASSSSIGNVPGSENNLSPRNSNAGDTLQETATRGENESFDAGLLSVKSLTGDSAGETPSTTADPSVERDDASEEKNEGEREDSTHKSNQLSERSIEAERSTEIDSRVSKETETASANDSIAAGTETIREKHQVERDDSINKSDKLHSSEKSDFAVSLVGCLESASETPIEAERSTEVDERVDRQIETSRAKDSIAAGIETIGNNREPIEVGPPGNYKVVHSKVVIRKRPDRESGIWDVLSKGTVVFGTPHEVSSGDSSSVPWLKLSGSSLRLSNGEVAEEAWLLLDGAQIGLGKLLEREPEGTAIPALSQKELKKLMEHAVISMPDLQAEGTGAIWVVVGGAGKGGVLVRSGEALDSRPFPSKLVTGSKIEEIEIIGNRFHYRRLRGDGPDFGWINMSLHNRPLIQLLEQEDY